MRLIDADALVQMYEELKDRYKGGICCEVLDSIIKDINNAPTIEQSDDLISRQWLLDLYDIDTTDFMETAKVPLEVVIQNIKDAPSVSIQPKTLANDCDLISREEVLALINKAMFSIDNRDIQDYIFNGLRRDVHNLPSADRPKGEWVENINFVHLAWECSECGAITSFKTPFCYECGADMRGDENERK